MTASSVAQDYDLADRGRRCASVSLNPAAGGDLRRTELVASAELALRFMLPKLLPGEISAPPARPPLVSCTLRKAQPQRLDTRLAGRVHQRPLCSGSSDAGLGAGDSGGPQDPALDGRAPCRMEAERGRPRCRYRRPQGEKDEDPTTQRGERTAPQNQGRRIAEPGAERPGAATSLPGGGGGPRKDVHRPPGPTHLRRRPGASPHG